jgi:hypothetical protein
LGISARCLQYKLKAYAAALDGRNVVTPVAEIIPPPRSPGAQLLVS